MSAKHTTYWPSTVDGYIIKYNRSADADVRERLYREHLHRPFLKLTEYMVNIYARKGINKEELMADLLVHLTLQLNKYHKGMGKSFSYFTVIAKHYLWNYNQKQYKGELSEVRISGITYMTTIQSEDHYTHHQDDTPKIYHKVRYPEELKVYPDMLYDTITPIPDPFLRFIRTHPTCGLTKKRDLKILDAIRTVVNTLDNHDTFHKKAIYLHLREITGYKTLHITNTIARIKRYYKTIK